METPNGSSRPGAEPPQPTDSTNPIAGRVGQPRVPKDLDLEFPLGSVAENGHTDHHAPKSESPIRDALRKLAPWSRSTPTIDDDWADGGIHEVTRATNLWFDREIGVLERDARSLAADWAGKGLPRHDVKRTAPLEVEQFLAGRCTETFRQWVDRVRVKMRDQIARETETIGHKLVELRASTTRIERLESEIGSIDKRVQELRTETKEDTARVGFEPIMPGWGFFWFFAVALTVIEFFANFPVFRLLLPLKPALAKAAEAAAQDAISGDWWAGLALQFKEVVLHADAMFVALVAVLFLVLFGKTIGGSARVLVALKPADQPLAATTIRSIKRQHLVALLGSVLGVTAVLAFLYLSRGSIASVAASRVRSDSLELERLRAEAQAIPPGDLGAIARSTGSILEQTRTLEIHRDDLAYATTVQNNNKPLFLLNLGLVFGAAVLGFLTYGQTVSDGTGEHPAIVQLRSDRKDLQRDAHGALQAGRRAEAQARAGIGRVEHLMSSSPLAEWGAKADRLTGVIPLFRGENARLRGIDPGSVLAFNATPPLALPTLEAERGFPEPADFARLKEEFEECRRNFAAVSPRIPIHLSDVSSL